jgi:D-alanyl-lipoteichoic acid acyltransferase DltB (MBOAT superfamily)
MENLNHIFTKKLFLFFSILLVLAPLLYYKYYNFLGSNIISGFTPKDLIAPVGISYYSLGVISYLVDVYRGKYKAYVHPGHYMCYVSYFGTITLGPIERANSFIPQLKKQISFDEERIFQGLKIISWGIFLKMVVADNLAILVDKIYGSPKDFTGLPLIIATMFFAIQLYADFNGYSHLALGFSKIIGIDIIENFKAPYFRVGVIDFWKGWHISLTSWLREYVYFPLGGNRKGKLRTFFNRIVVFLVSGLWHGASWNFVIWGGLHGVYQSIEALIPKKESKTTKIHFKLLGILITFILVDFAWIFFKAKDLPSALFIATHLFSDFSIAKLNLIFTEVINKRIFLMDFILIVFIAFVDYYKFMDKKLSFKIKLAFYSSLWIMIIFLSQNSSGGFIYFKF